MANADPIGGPCVQAILTDLEPILAGALPGQIGLWARNLTTGQLVVHQAGALFPPASTVKLAILYTLFRLAAAGALNLDDLLPLRAENQVAGSGVLRDLTPGITLPLRDYADLMIVLSDNTATNQLLDVVGLEAVASDLAALGLHSTRVNRKIVSTSSDVPLGEATPADLGRLLELIVREQVLTPAACRAMLAMLERQRHPHMLTRHIPEFYADPPAVRVASKGGWIRGTRNDVGAFFTPRGHYVLAVMSQGLTDLRPHPDNVGELALARIGALFYQHWGRPEVPT